MSDLTITKTQSQGDVPVTILHLSGQLDGSTEEQFLEQTKQVHSEGVSHLLVDLAEVTVLTSAGLRAIQNTFKLFTPQQDRERMRQHGDEPYKSPYFKMVCPNPQVYYILNISGFLQNILIYNDQDEALNSFTS